MTSKKTLKYLKLIDKIEREGFLITIDDQFEKVFIQHPKRKISLSNKLTKKLLSEAKKLWLMEKDLPKDVAYLGIVSKEILKNSQKTL